MAYARPSTIQDAIDLAPRLRVEDVAEIQAASGHLPLEALLNGVLGGTQCLTILDDQEVIGMFGVNHIPEFGEGQAAIWLLAAPTLISIKRQFLREQWHYLEQFHTKYPLLWNYVDARNVGHIKWLKALGFTLIKRHEHYGVEGRPFYEFVRIPHASAQAGVR